MLIEASTDNTSHQLAKRYPKLRVTHAERDFTAMFQSLKTLDVPLAV